MLDLLWLVCAAPLAGFAVLVVFGRRLGRTAVAAVGCGSVGVSAATALGITASFVGAEPAGRSITQVLWRWMAVGDLRVDVSLQLDPLALVMVLVVTGVGFLIHLYSVEFMAGEEGYARFFAAMNLFVASMLVLVLADNLVLLYLGWEGVGLCSYLLIGFWYADPANGRAARKAFVVTRVGDAALAIGLFLIFARLGSLSVAEVTARAPEQWPVGSGVAVAAAALLLGGAVGKSAQLPLQIWLPDAMAGPTPVSALIHAATMVTAGVYLIARTHALFELAPQVSAAVAVIGAATLLLAGFAALAQDDIKRVLAYSTISQIGYMFLALGVGAYSAAIFHLVTHAFFKALLFLAAGAVILALHHEHDIHRMGGLARRLPVIFWTFLAGAAALAGLPLVTSGFYSKGAILGAAWDGGAVLWLAGVVGALVTSTYIFRVVFVAFLGEPATPVERRPGPLMAIPLVVLAVLALVAGFLETPHGLGHVQVMSGFLGGTLPSPEHHASPGLAAALEVVAAFVSLVGVAAAWLLFRRRRPDEAAPRPIPAPLARLWAAGWGFDALYDRLLVAPYVRLAHRNRHDVVDRVVTLPAVAAEPLYRALSATVNGSLRRYAAWIAAGAAVVLALVMLW